LLTIIATTLDDGGLVLAAGSVEARKASASSGRVVADTTTRAVAARLVAVAVEGICARGALLLVASRASVASVAEAANVLHGIPSQCVISSALGSQVLLGPAGATVVAVIGADGSLASYTFVSGEALAGTNLAVAQTSVGALRPRVEIIGVDNSANPCKVLGAGSQGAVRAGPLGLSVEADEAVAVVVHLAGAVVGAVVPPNLLLLPLFFLPQCPPSTRRAGARSAGTRRDTAWAVSARTTAPTTAPAR